MAHNTASLKNYQKPAKYISQGNSPRVPSFCVGCKGKKEKRRRSKLFCGHCARSFRAARAQEQALDEMFERAIA